MAVAGVQAACISAGLPLQAFLLLVIAQAGLMAAGLLACFRRVGPRVLEWRPSLHLATGMIRDAWPLLLAGVSVSIYMRIDQVMLGKLAGLDAVGAYGAAAKVSEIWYFVPTAPRGIRLSRHRPHEFGSGCRRLPSTAAVSVRRSCPVQLHGYPCHHRHGTLGRKRLVWPGLRELGGRPASAHLVADVRLAGSGLHPVVRC